MAQPEPGRSRAPAAFKWGRRVGIAVLVVWAVLIGGAFVAQPALIYHPNPDIRRTPADEGLEFEELRIETADGETLGAWLVAARSPARGTVILCHGNAGNIGNRIGTAALLADLGMDVLLFDYRGFGTSTGSPDEAGLYADARGAWDFLVGRGVAPERIVIMGRSLGGAPAIWLAGEVDAAGLVAESTFTSIVDMGKEQYPFLPVDLLMTHRYESINRIAGVRSPVLVAHSPDDTLIDLAHGKALLERAPEPKRFLQLVGDHNDTIRESGAAYPEGLDAFFTEVLPADPN